MNEQKNRVPSPKRRAHDKDWVEAACDAIAWLVVATVGASPVALVVCLILITRVG